MTTDRDADHRETIPPVAPSPVEAPSRNNRIGYAAALGSGTLLGIAFLHASAAFLAWFALVPLLLSLRERDGRWNFLMGWLAGVPWFLISCHWLRHVTWAGLIALVLFEATWLGIWMAVSGRFHTRFRLIVFPLLWVVLETLRSKGALGFSWNQLGHLAPDDLVAVAQSWGVHGLSFLFAASNALLAGIWVRIRNERDWLRAPEGAGTLAALPILWLGVGWFVHWTAPDPRPEGTLRVGLVQGNFEQSLKWSVPTGQALERYEALTEELLREERVDLVVWPESAIPDVLSRDPRLLAHLEGKVREWRTDLLFGVLDADFRRGEELAKVPLFNSAVYLEPKKTELAAKAWTASDISRYLRGEEATPQRLSTWMPSVQASSATAFGIPVYDKARLLPFGEYVPFGGLIPWVQRFVETRGGGAFSAGEVGRVIRTEYGEFGMLICFESTFPGLARRSVLNGALALFNLTNDAWYLQTAAARQHALQSRFRAVETGRAVIRVANTGLSRVYLPDGSETGALPWWEPSAGAVEVPLYSHLTFQSRVGDFLGWLCMGCLALLWLLAGESPVGTKQR